MLKLIASDLDGTLLNSKKEISKKCEANIKKFIQSNNYFVMCSGRPKYRVKKYLSLLDVKGYSQYYIGFNGALVFDVKNNKSIFSKTLSREEANKVVQIAKENDVCVSIYTFDTVYTEKVSDYILENKIYEGVNFVLCDNLLSVKLNGDIYKVLFVDEPTKIAKVRSLLKEDMYECYNIVSSAPHYVEFMNKQTSKGNALRLLCEYLNIDLREVMAIGDAENDLSMLKLVSFSVAMENSEKEVKDICHYQTLSNDNDGVNLILEKVLREEL